MKLDFIEIAGFRGFRDRVRFELPLGFAVLNGRNGVGKSTVLDAVDFALTGTINKFASRGARGRGIDEHVWWVGTGKAEEYSVSVGFVFDDGERYEITRSRERGLIGDPARLLQRSQLGHETIRIPLETVMETTLIRDELIVGLSLDLPGQTRFANVKAALGGVSSPNYAARTNAILNAANEIKAQQEKRTKQAQDDLGRALTSLTEMRSVAERTSDVSEALRTIESVSIDSAGAAANRLRAVREWVASRRATLRGTQVALNRARELLPQQSYSNSPEGKQEVQKAQDACALARARWERADQDFRLAKSISERENQRNERASHLFALFEHGSALGLRDGEFCPLCGSKKSHEEFSAALVDLKKEFDLEQGDIALAERNLTRAKTAMDDAAVILMQSESNLQKIRERSTLLSREVSEIMALYHQAGFDVPFEDVDGLERQLQSAESDLSKVERALFTLETSSAFDRIATMESRTSQLRSRADQEASKLADAERAVEVARQVDASTKTVANQILTEQFDVVMPLLKELYRRLRPHTDWTEIESDFGGRVRASLNLTVGDGHNTQFLFSSGQRRAAGLAFLLAVHLSRPWCLWHSLLLDDPVQHIDDYRSLNLVEVLAAIRRTGRQVIVAVEDPALADVLTRRLRSSIGETGRRFDLRTSVTGTAEIAHVQDVFPMPREVLRPAEAS